jgi:hypothetical protein
MMHFFPHFDSHFDYKEREVCCELDEDRWNGWWLKIWCGRNSLVSTAWWEGVNWVFLWIWEIVSGICLTCDFKLFPMVFLINLVTFPFWRSWDCLAFWVVFLKVFSKLMLFSCSPAPSYPWRVRLWGETSRVWPKRQRFVRSWIYFCWKFSYKGAWLFRARDSKCLRSIVVEPSPSCYRDRGLTVVQLFA